MKSHTLRLLLACLWCWATLIPLRAIPLWVFAGGTSSGSGPTSPGTTNLLAWYALESSGADSSGNGRTLGLFNNPVSYVPGLVGNAVDIDNVNDFLSRGSEPWMNFAGEFTIGLWIKPDDGRPAAIDYLFGRWNISSNRSHLITLGTDGKMNFLVSSDGTSNVLATSTTVLADGAASGWTFIVGVFSPSTSVKIYINGVLEDTETASIPASVHTVSASLMLGNGNSTSSNTYLGLIDEPFIYGAELSDDNITWLYNSGAGRTFSDL